MKRTIVERYIVTLLFIAVLVTFSFAHRDSKKLDLLYANVVKAGAEQFLATTVQPTVDNP
jgi:hypothetical protein